MSEKIICPSCQAENDEKYNYCVSCGAPLNAQSQPINDTPASDTVPTATEVDNTPVGYSSTADVIQVHVENNSQSNNYYDNTVAPDITVEEASAFVKSNQSAFIPKFMNFKNGSTASWNWPVFIFQFFLNIGFVWFFHRKMKKQGFIALLLSAVLAISSIAGTYLIFKPIFRVSSKLLYETYDTSYDYYDYDSYNDYDYYDYYYDSYGPDYVLELFTEEDIAQLGMGVLLSSFSSLLSVAYTIVLPIMANKIYYKHCLSEIRSIKAIMGDTPAYIPTLSANGGTSSGLAVTTGILFWLISIFTSFTIIITMFSQLLFSSGLL